MIAPNASISDAVPLSYLVGIGTNVGSINGNANINGTVSAYAALNTSSITVELFARTNEGGGDLISRTDGAGAGFIVTNVSSLDVTYAIDDGAGGSELVTIPISHGFSSRWDHVAWTYDPETGRSNVYIDGQLKTSNEGSETPGRNLYWQGANTLWIGHDMDGAGLNGSGSLLDEVRISSIPLTPQQMLCAALQVDFGAAGQQVHPGFQAFTRSGDIDGPVAATFDSVLGTSGQVTVTVDAENTSNTIDFRDRGDSSLVNIGELIDDQIMNQSGGVQLTLSDLAAGEYLMTTWHHDLSGAADGLLDILVSDALGSDRLVADDLAISTGDNPLNLAQASYRLFSDGASPIVIFFDDAFSGNVRTPLNAFSLVAVPEPGTFALLLLGCLAMLARRTRASDLR